MQARSFILRSAAFFLVIIFSQKTGAGLFLHNLLHTNAAKQFPQQQKDNKNEISYACNCIDDFLTPFTEADELVFVQPVSDHIIPVESFKAGISFRTVSFSSLRGPPSNTL